jgi:predicted glycoside hydrolase/deacetylase ChbG (UPF0249 family)
MRKLIITADDFGISKGVNDGILEAFHRGVVRNTALLVNFDDVEESAIALKKTMGLEIGIHLNLTSGPPVSDRRTVPSLIGADGSFLGLGGFFKRAALGRIDFKQVAGEWRAQIERGHRLGFRFSNINSHQHVHMLPSLARICVDLAGEYRIPAVRLSRFQPGGWYRPPPAKALALFPFAMRSRQILDQHRMVRNDYIMEIPSASIDGALARLRDALRSRPSGVTELVCHPGYVDRTLELRDRFTTARMFELEFLTSPRFKEMLDRESIELTGFSVLAVA